MIIWSVNVTVTAGCYYSRSGLESSSPDRGLTAWWCCQVNNVAITNIHSPVLIGASEDLNQVPRLWFLVRLGLEQTGNTFEFATDCLETTAVHLRTLTWTGLYRSAQIISDFRLINKADDFELHHLLWLNKCSINTHSRRQYEKKTKKKTTLKRRWWRRRRRRSGRRWFSVLIQWQFPNLWLAHVS